MIATQKRLFTLALTLLSTLFVVGSLYGATGTRHVFYLDSGGHVHQIYSTASGWSDVDVTALTNAPVAASGSALTSVFDHSTNFAHVYYLDTNRHVYELYGTATTWHGDDPTALANGALAGSDSALTSVIGTGSVIHVFYLDAVGNLYELYWLGGTNWHSDSPSNIAGVGPICGYANPPLTSFIDFSNGHNYMHVFCLASGELHELYWIGGSAWYEDDPRSLAGGPLAAPGSRITSFIDNSNNSSIMHVFYLGTNNNIYELYYAGWPWHSDDPTSLAGSPSAIAGSSLTSFLGTSTGMHLMFLGTNEHSYELHWSTAWSWFDATSASHGISAAPGSALTSFQDLAGGARLYFIGTNSHLYELYWQSEPSASETDVTAASGGPTVAGGTSLTSVVGP